MNLSKNFLAGLFLAILPFVLMPFKIALGATIVISTFYAIKNIANFYEVDLKTGASFIIQLMGFLMIIACFLGSFVVLVNYLSV